MSLQYLKNKLLMEFIFCMQINIKVSASWHYFFDASGLTCPAYSKWEVSNIFGISKVKKNIDEAYFL